MHAYMQARHATTLKFRLGHTGDLPPRIIPLSAELETRTLKDILMHDLPVGPEPEALPADKRHVKPDAEALLEVQELHSDGGAGGLGAEIVSVAVGEGRGQGEERGGRGGCADGDGAKGREERGEEREGDAPCWVGDLARAEEDAGV